MSKTQTELEVISAKIQALESSTSKSQNITKIVYSILIVVAAIYAFYIPSQLKHITQPEVISTMAMDLVEDKIPENEVILKGVEDLANREISNAFNQLDKKIPELKQEIITAVDTNFGLATESINELISNDIAKMFRDVKDKLDENKSLTQDKDNLDRLASTLSEGVQLQLNAIIDSHLKIDVLDSMLAKLQYKKNLTQEEYTQKQVIAYAWVLASDEEYREELKGKTLDLLDKANTPIAE
ncbi:hypothetical protein PQO03_21040 [Lentisphaera profundi]|uniref:Uncharacterized protein n=1 Tax=Lentisphaera profundi TaxID=1658616 RepID=A0ABY7VVP9_9BACT|nr:hypothetical protein [Lentisphaera profundi]WDE98300.1 hypothetical protein PQO03_21040 [Lentisphaera profundi]